MFRAFYHNKNKSIRYPGSPQFGISLNQLRNGFSKRNPISACGCFRANCKETTFLPDLGLCTDYPRS